MSCGSQNGANNGFDWQPVKKSVYKQSSNSNWEKHWQISATVQKQSTGACQATAQTWSDLHVSQAGLCQGTEAVTSCVCVCFYVCVCVIPLAWSTSWWMNGGEQCCATCSYFPWMTGSSPCSWHLSLQLILPTGIQAHVSLYVWPCWVPAGILSDAI